MSLLALLAASAPVMEPAPGPAPAVERPATTDADTLALRPAVSALSLAVGPDRTHKTITSAIAAVPAGTTADIIVDPGVYMETVTTRDGGLRLFGAGPGVQVVAPDNATAVGVLDTKGSVYVEGMEFILPPTTTGNWPKYPLHGTSVGVTAFVDVRFTARNTTTAQGRPSAVGADMNNGSTTTFLRCVFDGASNGAMATNLHGWSTNTTPLTVIFADCTTVKAQTTGYDDLGSGLADEVWVIGHTGGLDLKAKGTNVTLHTDWTGPLAAGSTTLRDTRTDWPRVRA